MSDNNLEILNEIEIESLAREILYKTENGALVWLQRERALFYTAMTTVDGFDHWEYWVSQSKLNTSTEYIDQYTLDIMLNDKPFMSIQNEAVAELYVNIDTTLRRSRKKLHKAMGFVQDLIPCTDNHVYTFIRNISPFGIPGGEVFGILVPRYVFPVTLPSGIASAQAFGTAVIAKVGAGVILTGISTSETFGEHTLLPVVTLESMTTLEAFGVLVLDANVDIVLTGIVSTEAFGDHIVAQILLEGMPTEEAFGSPEVGHEMALLGIETAEAFGDKTGIGDIILVSIPSAEAFGIASLGGGVFLTGIGSEDGFFEYTIVLDITPLGVSGAEEFGVNVLTTLADIALTGIESSEAFDTHLVSQPIDLVAIAGAEEFGEQSVGHDLFLFGVPSAEEFRSQFVSQPGEFFLTGIVTTEAFGDHIVDAFNTITLTGIASVEIFGDLEVELEPVAQFRQGNSGENEGLGDASWTDPEFGGATDALYAVSTLTAGQTSVRLKITDYGFTVPGGATITGIKVDITRYATSEDIQDLQVRLVKGGLTQTHDKAAGGNWPDGDNIGTVSYGGDADLWGDTWTPANINDAGFGAVLRVQTVGGDTANVDGLEITVYYI